MSGIAAFNRVLGCCAGGEECGALLAKLKIISHDREAKTTAECHRIRNAAAARGVLGNSATAGQLWDAAQREADEAVTRGINACLDVGVSDPGAIGESIGQDAKNFLTTFVTTAIQASYAPMAADMTASALAKASHVTRQAISMAFDRKQAGSQGSKSSITIHGGINQVGDHNRQTVNYQGWLREAAQALEGSATDPEARRRLLAEAFREAADLPDIEDLMAAAARAAESR